MPAAHAYCVDMSSAVERLAAEDYVSLTTFRRDGTGVPTTVWAAREGDALYVWTAAATGKVKRIRRRSDVTVAASSRSGHPRGEPVPATAEVLDAAGSARTRQLIKKRYGWIGRIVVTMSVWRRGPEGSVGIRISFPAD